MVTIHTNRTYYSAIEAEQNSITIKELIDILSQYDEDEKIILSNDNGYTYGHINKRIITD